MVWKRATGVAAAAMMAAACAMPNPETAHVEAQPHTPPAKTVTSFSDALTCMDDLLWSEGKHDIYITSAGIPDATGKIATGTKEMMISAVSRMSVRSNAFRWVDYDPTEVDVQALSDLVGIQPQFTVPSYYIRGAITQLDDNVLENMRKAGVSVSALDALGLANPFANLNDQRNQVVSVVSVDLNVGHLATRQIMPGLSATNSIAVVRSGRDVNAAAGGELHGQSGVAFAVNFEKTDNKAEGFHQAVRTLVDLSVIEVLGKLSRTPYWQCLSIDQTLPSFRAEARQWYDAMPPDERTAFVRAVLANGGYAPPGASGPAFTEAVARYQADNALIASGRVDFDLYYSLLGRSRQLASGPGSVPAAPAPAPAAPPPRAEAEPALFLDTDRGPTPLYRVAETVAVTAQPSVDAYVYCWYRDGDGSIAKIFPNRFQPDAFIPARQVVRIPPGPQKPFVIRIDKKGVAQAVACVATPQEVGTKLPDRFKVEDLVPLPALPLAEIIGAYRQAGGGQMIERTLEIKVAE